MDVFLAWEVSLIEFLQEHMGERGIAVLSQFSLLGEEKLMIVILGFLYWSLNRALGEYVGLNVLMGILWNPMVKNLFLRPRPYFDHPTIHIYRVVNPEADIYNLAAQDYSFPSGHSTCVVSTFGSLANRTRRAVWIGLAVLLPLLTGLSRVVVGAHYPTDVLGGWAVGLAAILVVPRLRRAVKSQAAFYGILLLTALPGLFYCTTNDYFSALGLMLGFFAGTLFEARFVRFQNTRRPLTMILRVAGGLVIFLVLSALLKLPFSSVFLESGSFASHMVRTARYGIIAFVEFGLYPMAFALEKTGGRRLHEKGTAR